MIWLGADFNWYEYIHRDLILSHKLFLDELINNPKMQKLTKRNTKKSLLNKMQLYEDTECLMRKATDSTLNAEKSPFNNIMIANNKNCELFIRSFLSDDQVIKQADPSSSLIKTCRVLEDIKEKILVDSMVRPLKIFWIKSDYVLMGKIVAGLGTAIAMMLSNIIKSTDFSKYL